MKYFDNTFSMARHYHPYIEIMYCNEGSFLFEVLEKKNNKDTFKTYTIEKNEFVIVDAYTVHKLMTPSEEPCFIYNIEFSVLDETEYNPFNVNSVVTMNLNSLLKCNKVLDSFATSNGYVILKDNQTVGHQLRTIISAINKGINDLNDAITYKTRLILLINEICKCVQHNKLIDNFAYVKKAKEYIAQNYAENITIDDIANHVFINKYYLQRFFKKMTGTTILKYINDYRLNICKDLLTSTSLSIEEITAKAGFRNRQHLIYAFKNRYDITPSEYRKKYLNAIIDYSAQLYESGDYDLEHRQK